MSLFRMLSLSRPRSLSLVVSGLLLAATTGWLPPHGWAHEGQERLVIFPDQVILDGADAQQTLLAERALEEQCVGPETSPLEWWSSDPEVVTVADGVARPVGNGSARIVARAKGREAEVTVEVRGMQRTNPAGGWEFTRHVLPVLSKNGCNSGACHGALAGKGGFKLSLRGYNPDGDYFAITRQAQGRRVEFADPGRSLLLAKPSGALPHKGGLRFEPLSDDYRVLAEWIIAGAAPPRHDVQLERTEVWPRQVTLKQGEQQPLVVRAFYSDGRVEDVTRWVKFSSTNETVASVDDGGRVSIVGSGEGAIVAWFSSQIVLARVTVPFPNEVVPQQYADAPRRNFIDQLVLDKLQQLNLTPSPRSSDSQFLRRAYLDAIGTLPTPAEVQAFLNDDRFDKRDRLIDDLLTRTEYVDYWTYKWSDLLLVNGRRLRPVAVKTYYDWIHGHVSRNTPWDELVRQIITATGETNVNGATNFYSLHQSPEEMSENICQAFLSLSIGCAKCHNHPLEKWTNDQYYALASHFARVRAKGWGGDGRGGDGVRTVVLASEGELVQPLTGRPQPPAPLDGEPLAFAAQGDRREHLADWLTNPANPYFSRAIVNRVWANFFGIGLVEPVDDLRASNPARNEPLLRALADYVVERDFDLKSLMRTIMQSETYQRSSDVGPGNQADDRYFSRYFPRRLTAEVLLDAISLATDVPTEFTQIGYDGNDFEKTTAYPMGTRAIQLADSAVVSNFLKTFGRNERDITCECERSNTPSMVQVLHISNGVTINQRLAAETGCVSRALAADRAVAELITDAYLRTLARLPEAAELHALEEVMSQAGDGQERRELLEDLYWGLMSSREFLFNH